MTTTYKILSQTSPSASTSTVSYTCPAATQTIVSSIVVCNTNTAPISYRISVRPNADTLATKHYVAYDTILGGSTSGALTIGIVVDAADVVDVYASSTGVSFSLFGAEIA